MAILSGNTAGQDNHLIFKEGNYEMYVKLNSPSSGYIELIGADGSRKYSLFNNGLNPDGSNRYQNVWDGRTTYTYEFFPIANGMNVPGTNTPIT